MKQPYKYWTKTQLLEHLVHQGYDYNVPSTLIHQAVFDDRWNPIEDFNGCNLVQDDFHPFLPCFIHDWRWICFDYQRGWDWEFRENLLKFGFKKWKAELYYIMVRLGYIFYYQFKKK